MPEILRLEPWMKEVVWGSDRLQRHFGKRFDPGQPLGETWEVSAIEGHESRIRGSGEGLRGWIGRSPDYLGLGPGSAFPLLVKLLAPAQWLSVQVHPDDAQAIALEGPGFRGKHEAWLVLEAEPGAAVLVGLAPGIDAQELDRAVRSGLETHVMRALRRVPVAVGDLIDVPPGTVHALGPGLTLLEVQQPSDLTYRLFDWNRVGLDGRPRTLHLDRGLEVVRPDSQPIVRRTGTPRGATARELRVSHEHFRIETWSVTGRARFPLDDFAAFVVLRGAGTLRIEGEPLASEVRQGDSGLVPRGARAVALEGDDLLVALAMPPLSQ